MLPPWVWVVLVAVDYGVIHSLLAADRVKRSAEQRYPTLFPRYYRLAYNFLAFVFLIPIGLLMLYLPDTRLYTIPFPYILATLAGQGVCLLAAGLALKGTGVADLTGIPDAMAAPSTPAPLKTDGAYSLVRHPVYTLAMVAMALFPWMTANRLALFITFAVYMVVGAGLEERRLLRTYGEEYASYRRRVPMFLPRLFTRSEFD
jgi:protein-S-isoprenylcysteine O-methyltransferase Ste14